jgi:hypothetical protein
MSARIYPEGFQYMDSVAPWADAGSELITEEALVVSGDRVPPWWDKPDQQRSDLFLNQSLQRWMNTPREVLAQIRPPLPPIPPTEGYRTVPLTLDDVVAGNFSPVVRRPRRSEDMSGSSRNSMSAQGPL